MINSINSEVKKYYRDCGKGLDVNDWRIKWGMLRGYPSYIYQSKRISDTKEIINRTKLEKPILDAACGSGYLLADLPSGSVGIDINPRHIRAAKINAPLAIVKLGDIEKTLYRNGYFKTIIIAEVFEHIPVSDLIINEAWRVLSKGGRLIITVPSNNFLWKLRFLASSMYQTEPQCITFDQARILKMLSGKKYKVLLFEKIAWGLNYILIVEKK